MRLHRVLLVALMCASTVGCVSRSAYEEKIEELRSAKTQLREVGDLAKQYGEQLAELQADNDSLKQQNEMLRGSSDESARRIDELMTQLRSQPGLPAGVEGIGEAGAYTYRVDGGVLFDPGKCDLKPSGKKTITDMAALLKQHDYKIEVAGHTDNDPVAKTIKQYPRGNMELGAERALAVYEALKQAGIPESRMRVSSYGEHSPVEEGNKPRNRRVEIRVLLSEPAAQ
ncbi:MAG: OmpA family protein [Planctomycetes bacterium]|nr:OmpA family protein [Planctomycetota bacterium]